MFVRGGWIFVGLFESLAVRVIAHRFGENGQEVVVDFQAVSLAFETAVDKYQLSLRAEIGVGVILKTPRAYLNSELE